MTVAEPAVEVGDIASTVMLSPCVGGLLRTWDEANESAYCASRTRAQLDANLQTGRM